MTDRDSGNAAMSLATTLKDIPGDDFFRNPGRISPSVIRSKIGCIPSRTMKESPKVGLKI